MNGSALDIATVTPPGQAVVDLATLPNEDSQTLVGRLKKLLALSGVVNSTLQLDHLLDIIASVATEATETEAASILLPNTQETSLRFGAATGSIGSNLRNVAVPMDGSLAGWIVTNNQPVVVRDVGGDPRHWQVVDRTMDFRTRSLLGVPLRIKERTIGVIEVVNKVHADSFFRDDVQILELLAAQAATAVENARLYGELQHQMQDLKTVQSRALQSEKLAAVGGLVAGVAHELNNPLTSVIAYAQLLTPRVCDEESREDLLAIVAEADRAAAIVQGLLDFARQRPPERTSVDINELLRATVKLMTSEMRRHHVACDLRLSRDIPRTSADPHQLQQVIVNLIGNAQQAMAAQGGGKLTISTGLVPAVDGRREIRVEVRDTGPGISEANMRRIFDPFFTTKALGQGTGLGLSICHGIVAEHGGCIMAASEVGSGTRFHVTLPAGNASAQRLELNVDASSGRAEEDAIVAADDTSPRVLLIDDEPALLKVLTKVLKRQAFEVDGSGDGDEALHQLERAAYDVVVCDVHMPGMDGPELYRRRPDLASRLVFITGDTVSTETREFLDETGARYLAKPFRPSELVATVREIMGAIPAA